MKCSITCLAAVGCAILAGSSVAQAGPMVVADADFVGGVYELRYYTYTNSLIKNGVSTTLDATPLDDLFITNAGNTVYPAYQYYGSDAGVRYLQATGASGGFGGAYNTSAAATMGFDLMSVSGQVAKVELLTWQTLFQFDPWNVVAFGDQVYADVATPATFGTGPYTNLYTFTGDNVPLGAGPSAYASNSVMDITSSLAPGWLSNPGKLEFRFGYTLQNTDIPGRHLQLFRSSSSSGPTTDDSFLLRITLAETPQSIVPEPGSVALLGTGLVVCAGWNRLRRRRTAVGTRDEAL